MSPDVNFLNIAASPLALNVQPSNLINPYQTQSSNSLSMASYTIRTDQTITINGGGDLDGNPLLPYDDALIYAAKGFTFNNVPILPVNRTTSGDPIFDPLTGKQVLVDNAVTVASGYTTINANNNPYIGLLPPKVVSPETITIPSYSDTKTQELNARTPLGASTITFNASSNPINNTNDWNNKFPQPGTSTNPKVVRVTGGGLNIPNGVNLSNYIITVDSGDINFNGNGNILDNVVLVTSNGNINLGKVQSNNLSVFASGAINMNGQARFGGKTLIANNSNNITFDGATKTATNADTIQVISQGNITFNGALDTRGDFLSKGTFIANGNAFIFGSINAKQNIIFNGGAFVTAVSSNSAPTNLSLSNNTTPENVIANTLIGNFTSADSDTIPQTFSYSLVAGTGSTDNAAFAIINNELHIVNSPNFEAQNSYSIRVRTTDQGGLSFEKTFNVNITDVNEAPTTLVLTNNSTLEIVAASSLIGTFASTDPDTTAQTFTYSLVAGTGSTDNAAFSIVNNELRIVNSPDFEAKSSYSIRVRTTDQGGLSYEKVFTVGVTDVNEAPTALVLSNNTTPENVAANSLIGTFASTDPDTTAQTFTYSLVAGTGSTDNAAFSIVNNELRIVNSPDSEAKSSYSIRVRTTDQGSLSFEKVFTVNITDVNEAPIALVLSNNLAPENIAVNALIGTFASIDTDTTPQTFTYSLVAGTGSTDNAAFSIVNNELRIVNSPDFETKNSYTIRVKTTDQGWLSYEKVFTIDISDINDAPTALVLSNNVTPENVAANSLIGTFASTDSDTTPQTFIYSLVAGTGSTDNAYFSIANNELRIVNSPDFEAKSSFSIRVRTTDQGGLSFEKVFTVGITDTNEAPIALILSNSTTPENVAANSLIGNLSSTDPDTTAQNFTYSLVTGTGSTDNAAFTIVNNELRIVNPPDFEAKNSYSIRVRTTDQGGLSYEKVFTVGITDINEVKPVGFMLDSFFDSAPIGDSQTTFATVKLVGLAFANATVTLQSTGTSVTADATGKFAFDNIALSLGDNSFTVNAIDATGNNGTSTILIKRVAQDNSDVILDWNATLLNAIAIDKSAPPTASRNMAIVQTAIFDAINSFTNTYKNYHFAGLAPTGASIEAAAASAAYRTLVNLYPTQTVYFDSALTTSLAQIADGTAEDAGVAFGRAVADDILAFRSTDGSSNPATYIPGTNLGDWQPTAPSFATALLPNWGLVTPFGLTSGSQFRPAGDPALTSDQYTADFNQVKDLGSLNSTTRTADQTEIAKFWADGAGTYTPPGHWNQIAENIVANQGNSLLDNARLFALLNIGLADAGIAAWDAKYTYNSWRPITAIQQADTDGNSNTLADPNWKPLIITPPFPEYVSGHSTFSGTAETILSALLGSDISFTTNSLGTPGIYRTFSNFTSAANEAGISRIYGGIHFYFSNVDGLATGRSVGNYILQNALAPVITLTTLSNNSTIENVPADSLIGAFNTTSESNRFTYSLVAGVGSTDNVAFTLINNQLHIVSSPDFETKSTYSIRVRTTDRDGSYAEKIFTISILDVNENLNPLAIAAQLQQDTGSNSTDKITSNPAITGTITAAGTIVELKAGFGTTASFDILSNYSNGNFTLDANRLNQIAGGTLTEGLKTLKISAMDNFGNLNLIDFGFTLDTNAPLFPSFGLAPAFDTSPVGDSQTTAANVTLTGQTEANAKVTLFVAGQTTGTSATADASGKFAFANVALNLGANAFTVEAKDIAGNISTFATTVTRAEIPPEVIQLSVKPGEQLKIDSKVVFGKTANFSLFSDLDLPISMLQGDGTLTFKPTPDQVGTYQFNLIARDGSTVNTQKFNLNVVADPNTTTRISGVIKNTDGLGLEGVVVTIGNFLVTTGSDGSFILTLPEVPPDRTALIIQPGQEFNGVVYPSIAEPLPLLLGHDVYGNVANIIDRPIYLPAIDVANAQTINPNINQTITSAAIPGSSVFVAANSLFDEEGYPYTEQLSITKVPTALTPAALPSNLFPDLVVTIQPGEMRFSTPAPLSLPNLAGYPVGTLMDLWSINPVTGSFDNVGTGQVSADGLVVNTISGGIRNSSWHFFAPPAPTPSDPNADPRNPDDGCNECKATAPATSEVQLHSGAVIETHELISYQSQGVSRGLTLKFDSERADARPILHFGYNNVQSDSSIRLMAELSIRRGDFSLEVPGFAGGEYGLNGGENFWTIPNGGGKIDAALQADLRDLASGRYDYDLTTGLMRFTNNQLNGTTSTSQGKFLHVNTSNSNFGSGWGLAGLEELVVNPDGSVLIIDGDGGELLFEKKVDNSYDSPPGDYSVLERLSDGTFRRTMKDETVYSFNSDNLLTKVIDRYANETKYLYQNRNLIKMVDPVGLETTFSYSGDRISAIIDPAGRSTNLTYDSNGNLTKITDPDGTSRTWEYDANHHMIAEVDKRGDREQTFYDFAGRAKSAIRKDGSVLTFDPIQVQGLYEANRTIDPVNAPVAFQLGQVASTYTDANGNQTVKVIDKAGQTVSATDAVGILPSVQRNQDNLVTRQTDSRGNITSYTYDAIGNVIATSTSSGSRQYSYDPIFNQVTSETDELGRKTLYDIDPLTGHVRTTTRVVGAVGGDDDLITSYSYTAKGLQDIIIDPMGNIVDYDYDSQGRTIKITFAKGTVDEATQQFEYDLAGNQTATIDELGRRTEYRYDLVNRLIETIYPDETPATLADNPRTKSEYDAVGNQIATIDELGRRSTFTYDKLDRLIKTTEPDPDGAGALLAPETRYEYDAIGNQTAMIDQLGRRTQYQYDARNRLIATIHADGSRETSSYDADSNLIASTDAKINLTTREYDSMGRLTKISQPNGNTTFEYDSANQLIAQTDANGNRTQYIYDELGRRVNTIDALGRSTVTNYDKNGNAIAETDELNRTTIYSYDNRDRQISTTRVVSAVGGDDDLITSYTYTAVGLQDIIIDPMGKIVDYDYDAQGRTIKITFAKGTADEADQQFEYDLAGNQTATIDELGRRTEYRYDLVNRLIETIYPDKTPATLTDNSRTKSEYDAVGNQIAKIDELGRRSAFEYDTQNRLVKTTEADPDGVGVLVSPEIRYEYDANGNKIAEIDQLDRRTEYQYDAQNRLIAIVYTDGSRETSTYDRNSNLTKSTDANGNITTREYDAKNRLIKIVEPNGNSTFEYDSADQLIAQTDANGNRTTYAYDEVGRRIRTIDAIGGISAINYDKNGNAIAATDQLDRTTSYGYDNRDRQTTTTSALGFTSRKLYDAVGNVVSAVDANNHATNYVYDERNRQTEAIDALNQSTKTDYDAVGNVTATTNQLNQTNTYHYDNLNRRIEAIDLLNQSTKTEYDLFGNVIAVIDPLGQRTSYGYDLKNRKNTVTDALGKVTTTTYDGFGNVLSIIDPANNQTRYEYQADITKVSVNSNGDPANSRSQSPKISADGRFVYFSSDASNLDASYNYNSYSYQNIFVRDRLTGTTNRIVSDVAYNSNEALYNVSADGRYVAFVSRNRYLVPDDTNNLADVFVYDREQEETTRVSVNSDGIEGGFAIGYGGGSSSAPSISADGRYVAFESYATNLVAGDTANFSPDIFVHDRQTGETTIVSVDSNGIKGNASSYKPSISPDGRFVYFSSYSNNLIASAPTSGGGEFVHDRLTGQTTRIGVNSSGDPASISADGKFVAFVSNSQVFVQNRETNETTLVSISSDGITASYGSSPSISADGRFVAFSSGSGDLVANDTNYRSDIFVRDRLTNQTLRVSLDGGEQLDFDSIYPSISANGKFITFTENGNNPNNGILVANNPFLSPTAFGSSINRLSSETNANGAVRKYAYDAVGNITSITDRDGTIQKFTYDKLNRRTQEQWINAFGNVTRNIVSTYNAAGELTQISDPDSTYSYTYDLDGRMLSVSNEGTPNLPTTIMSYSYDNVGNVLSMTDTINGSLGIETTREYDALNRLTVNAQGNKRVDYAYNAISQVTNKKRYSDMTGTNLVAETNHIYDSINRLTNITHSKGANTISSYAQTYDAGSKITSVTGADGSSTYTYDDTNQLTGADYDFQADESYSYDSNGNRTNDGYVTGVNNQLLEDNKYLYEYDLVGNRTKRTDKSTNEVMEYRWDIRDRLTGITVKNDLGEIIRTAEYTYDVYNQRIAKTVDTDGDGSLAAVTERFVYGSDQNIALVFDENGNVNHRYLFGDGVDQIEADESNGNVLWALTDHLGSVRDVVDDSGTVLNHVVYDAFGGVTSQTDESVVFRYGYTARELDAESGLQYNRARYLDSFTGKFISEDPISFEGGDFNLYRYVFNSPLNGTDPSGEVTVYDALNAADQFSGSFSRVVTFGATDYIREKIYGNDVNKNQTGTFANLGTGAGVVTSFLLGGSAPRALVGVTNLQRLAQAHTVIGTGLGAYQSTKNILNGCATPWDALAFAPVLGFLGKRLPIQGSSDRILVDFIGDGRPVSGYTGFLNSPRMPRSEIQLYRSEMNNIGIDVTIFRNTDKTLPGTNVRIPKDARGAFNTGTETIYLPKGATAYEAFHEGSHARQYAEIGKDAYHDLGRYARESYVFNQIYKNRNQFSSEELKHAVKYIRFLRDQFRSGRID